MENSKESFVANHIILNVLLQLTAEKIEEIKELDGIWKNKSRKISSRFLKLLDEHLNKSLSGNTEEGQQLQDQILLATNEISEGIENYKNKLIEYYKKQNTK